MLLLYLSTYWSTKFQLDILLIAQMGNADANPIHAVLTPRTLQQNERPLSSTFHLLNSLISQCSVQQVTVNRNCSVSEWTQFTSKYVFFENVLNVKRQTLNSSGFPYHFPIPGFPSCSAPCLAWHLPAYQLISSCQEPGTGACTVAQWVTLPFGTPASHFKVLVHV